MDMTEKRFESDIESFLISAQGGYTKTNDTYDKKECLYVDTLINFVKRTQPKEWARFEKSCNGEPAKKFLPERLEIKRQWKNRQESCVHLTKNQVHHS